MSELSLEREVTGVLKVVDGVDKIPATEALRKALADSKLSGINLGLDPRTSEMSTQLPSTSDSEASFTDLASS